MKRFFAFLSAFLSVIVGISASSVAAGAIPSTVGYSVVSAVVNKEYDFKDDFQDSYPYDEDFYTEGIFTLDDYNADITLTLKNNATGDTFIYEKTPQAEWSVKASVDHLLYETSQLDAAVHIYDLGGDYGIQEVDVPVKITVVSSLYSADYHKYPSYEGNHTAMYEGVDFSVDYDSLSDGKARITLLKKPWLFSLSLYNAESRQLEDYDPENADFEFPTEVEVTDFDPTRGSFWFFIPGKLTMDDGYDFHFTMSVNGFLKNKATPDSAKASPDSVKPSAKTTGANFHAIQTGEGSGAYFLLAVLMISAAGFVAIGFRRRKL